MTKFKIKRVPIKQARRAHRSVTTEESFRLPRTGEVHGVDAILEDLPVDFLIALEAGRKGVDPKTIRGMVRQESSGRPGAVSDKGARGLMQVMPGTARYLGFKGEDKDLHKPNVSIALGVGYFKKLLDKYKGDVTKALAAYNAGPGAVDKYGGVPPFEETEEYVEKVKGQSFQEGGKVGVFDREMSPMRVKPGMDEAMIDAIVERALGKVLGEFSLGGPAGIQLADGGQVPELGPVAGSYYSGGGIRNGAGVSGGFMLPGTRPMPASYRAPRPSGGSSPTGYYGGGSRGGFTPPMQNVSGSGGSGSGGSSSGGSSGGSGSGGYMGGISQTANQLRNFNPFTPGQQATLNQITSTGLKADVSGAAEAAKSQGAQIYNQLTAPQINEQMGAMGLGSSSARTSALAREAANVGTNVGNTALMADINAQENAANRQLGSFNPILGGSSQVLSGMGTSGQLQLGQAGVVSGERMAEAGLANQMALQQSQLAQQAAMQNQQLQFQQAMFNAQQGYASGGRVDEADHLSNLLYGVHFNRDRRGSQAPGLMDFSKGWRGRGGSSSGGDSAMQRLMLEREKLQNQAMSQQLNFARHDRMKAPASGGRQRDWAEEKWKIANTPSGYGPAFDQMRREQALQFIGAGGQGGGSASFYDPEAEAAAKARAQQQIAQFYLNQNINPITGAHMGTPNQTKAEGGRIHMADTEDWDDGGILNGPKYPADRIHVMAQGGEGVLPLDLMEELEHYESNDPMIGKIKGLMGMGKGYHKMPDGSMMQGEKHGYADGGSILSEVSTLAPDIADILLFGDLRDNLVGKATADQAARVSDLPSYGGDKIAHTVAAERLARRFGEYPTRALLNTKESITGLANLLLGDKVASPTGLDVSDLHANERGIAAAKRPEIRTGKRNTALIRGQKGGKIDKNKGEFKRGYAHGGQVDEPIYTGPARTIGARQKPSFSKWLEALRASLPAEQELRQRQAEASELKNRLKQGLYETLPFDAPILAPEVAAPSAPSSAPSSSPSSAPSPQVSRPQDPAILAYQNSPEARGLGPLGKHTYTNQDLDQYAEYRTPALTPEQLQANRLEDYRRKAQWDDSSVTLYSALMATARPAARAKLGALLDKAVLNRDESTKAYQLEEQLQAQQAQAQAQMGMDERRLAAYEANTQVQQQQQGLAQRKFEMEYGGGAVGQGDVVAAQAQTPAALLQLIANNGTVTPELLAQAQVLVQHYADMPNLHPQELAALQQLQKLVAGVPSR